MIGLFIVEDFILQGFMISVGDINKDFYDGLAKLIGGVELFTCCLFVMDQLVQVYGYGWMYLQTGVNIFDTCMVTVYLAVLIVTLKIDFETLYKIKGILRVIRVIVLVRYLQILKTKSQRHKFFKFDFQTYDEHDFVTVEEIVVKKLTNIIYRADSNDPAVVDLEYVIKQIANHSLYEGVDFMEDNDDDESEES